MNKRLIKFNLYDQLILIHGSRLRMPYVEIPSNWSADVDFINSSTAILLDVGNISENTVEAVELYLSDSNTERKNIFNLTLETEHHKLYFGDHENNIHETVQVEDSFTRINASYDVQGNIIKLFFTVNQERRE